ncbi:MAG: helix-turn-helix transcriptional regulator [Defluviitaleaceae bacterium]|nr:helix-turn-helix transcriptional regulator [Defluviitaleaceae bacterium]
MNKRIDMYKSVGYRLAECRKNNGLSQSKLSDILKIPQRTYAGYELGDRRIPLDMLLEIANYYKLSVAYFVENSISEAV